VSAVPEQDFARAAAADLQLLAILHDREPHQEILKALSTCPFQDQLSLILQKDGGRSALEAFDNAVAALPVPIDGAALDALASDYACVYLRYTYRASPTESVWFDKDGLERQEPMLAVRDWYREFGLQVEDWAKRPADHLVLQLQFVAFLLEKNEDGASPDLKAAAQFLDEHLLRWIGLFADQLKKTKALPYFAGLASLTFAYVDEIRDHLETLAGLPRTKPKATKTLIDKRSIRTDEEIEPYHPGMGPSW
jgi:TorA maturation chaperone TorD